MSRPLFSLHNLSLILSEKVCFEAFSAQVPTGERIALIGDNGSGKSTLLRIIAKEAGVAVGYLEQKTPEASLSGGQRQLAALEDVLTTTPDLLLLDEPTNHLDQENRAALRSRLWGWTGTVIVITHDEDLLDEWAEVIWHIENATIRQFRGHYRDYLQERAIKKKQTEEEFERLRRRKRALGRSIDQEQTRRVRSMKQGKKRYSTDKVLRKGQAERAENAMGYAHKRRVREERDAVGAELAEKRRPPKPAPRFHFGAHRRSPCPVEVDGGAVGFPNQPLLRDLHFSVADGEGLALVGPNGCGKTTLMRALLGDATVERSGSWRLTPHIGYLDQHYSQLPKEGTVREALRTTRPDWSVEEIARHLGAFLFLHRRTWEKPIAVLSEGEKARLSLALIAANAPDLLILDEITNNLDLTTKEHLIEVLRGYPGALVISCHEKSFLERLGIENHLQL